MESLKAQGLEPGGLYSNSDSIQRYIHSRVSDAKIQGPSLTASSKVLYLYFTFVNVYGVEGVLKRLNLLHHLMKRFQTTSVNQLLAKYYILF